MLKLILALVASTFLVSNVVAANYDPLGEEDETPMILGVVLNLPFILAGAVKHQYPQRGDWRDHTDLISKVGYVFPRDGIGYGITTGPEFYVPVKSPLKMGLSFSFSEIQGTPMVDTKLDSDTFVGCGSLNLRIDFRGVPFVGLGIGYFLATSDRKDKLFGEYPTFGSGKSYQMFAGIMSRARNWSEPRFLAEVRYSILRATSNRSLGFEELFRDKDFGGVSLNLGLVF